MNFLPNYISVGVDVASSFSWFCILTPDGKEFRKSFKVMHDSADSLKNAVLTIKKAEEQYSMKSKIFLESTGIYHFPLFCHLNELGFEVFVINPLITNSNKNIGIRKVKNDRYDAKRIAYLGYSPDLKVSVMPTDLIMNLRCLCREYYSLIDNRSAYLNKLKSQLSIVFPGFSKVFSNVTGATSIAILTRFSTPEAILNAEPNQVLDLIALTSRKGLRYAKTKYELLLNAASNALNFRYNLSSVYDVLDLHLHFIQQYDKKIELILSKISMSKRGSRIARRVLYAVALASVRVKRNGDAINPVLHAYYQKKKESKAPKVALGAIMHKISNIIFAVLRDQKHFELKTPEQHKKQYQKLTNAA